MDKNTNLWYPKYEDINILHTYVEVKMKRTKGFTLTELLAVLVVISILAVIAVPNISKLIQTYKQSLLNTQINNIEEAARDWGASNIYLLPTGDDISVVKTYEEVENGTEDKYGVLIINLGLLKESGKIASDIKNPVTNEPFDDNLKIYITNETSKITYKVQMS